MTSDIDVTGGSHGVVAQTEEIWDRAAALRRAAAALADADVAAAALRRRLAHAALATADAPPPGRAAAAGALESLHGVRGLRASAEELTATARGLDRTAKRYVAAEERARAGFAAAGEALGIALGQSPVLHVPLLLGVLSALSPSRIVSTVLGIALARPWRYPLDGRHAEALVAASAGFLVSMPPGPTPDDPVAVVARLLAQASGGIPQEPADLTSPSEDLCVTLVRVVPHDDPVNDVASALRLVAEQTPQAGAALGQVAVQRLDHADGTRSWVVTVPGTQDGSSVYDWNSNFALVGGAASAAVALVARAMDQAGIRPGEPVALVGHSQGGMIAAHIAADPVLQRKFTMRALMTAGSPVASTDLPDSLQTLSIEHREDLIPAADGAPNPDTPTRTTVVADAPDAEVGEYGAAHDLTGYIRTGERLEDVGGSVADFHDELAAVLGGDDVVGVTTLEFQGIRGDVPRAPTFEEALRGATTLSTVAPLPGVVTGPAAWAELARWTLGSVGGQ